jgi:hypothetical protein
MPPLDPLDPVIPAVAAPAIAPSPAPTPPAEAPAVANPAVAPPAPAEARTPAPAEPAPAPLPEPKAAPAVEPTLLQKFDDEQKAKAPKPVEATKPADAKVAEAPKPGEEPKPAETAAAEPPKPAEPAAPIEYKYTLPETLKMDDALKADVHKAFDDFRANPAEGAQRLVDLHTQAMERFAEQTLAEQHRVFNQTREEWRKQVASDPEIGGAGHQTAMGAIARMRNLVSRDMLEPRTTADGKPMISELDEFLQTTGAGDHPVFLKMLHRFARYFDEGQEVVADGKPTKNNGARPRSGLYTDASRAKMQV